MAGERQDPRRKSVTGLAAMDERTKALEEAREHAAREPLATLLRMREDLEKAGKRKLADILAFLAEHVFEPRVNADFAAKAVGSTAKAVSPRLREETGAPRKARRRRTAPAPHRLLGALGPGATCSDSGSRVPNPVGEIGQSGLRPHTVAQTVAWYVSCSPESGRPRGVQPCHPFSKTCTSVSGPSGASPPSPRSPS